MREPGPRPQLGAGALILRRTGGLGAERVGSVPSPARVVEEAAGERHPVSAPFGNDRLCLAGVGDHADRLHGDPARFLDHLGERHLIARRDHNTRLRADPARRHAHIVEPNLFQFVGVDPRVFRGQRAGYPVGAGDDSVEGGVIGIDE